MLAYFYLPNFIHFTLYHHLYQITSFTLLLFDIVNHILMFKIIKYAFMQRRKTLVNALEKSGLFKNKSDIIEILKKLGINEKIRGEALSLEKYANIVNLTSDLLN